MYKTEIKYLIFVCRKIILGICGIVSILRWTDSILALVYDRKLKDVMEKITNKIKCRNWSVISLFGPMK